MRHLHALCIIFAMVLVFALSASAQFRPPSGAGTTGGTGDTTFKAYINGYSLKDSVGVSSSPTITANRSGHTVSFAVAGTYLVPGDSLITHDWVSNQLAGKQALGTYLAPSDSTITHNWVVNQLAGKQASGTYLIPSDTTPVRNYSNNLYQAKGTYLIPSDTNWLHTNKIDHYIDSIRVGPAQWTSVSATDTIPLCRVWQSGMSVTNVWAARVGGTSASVSITRVRSGTAVTVLSSALATTTNASYLQAFDVANADQNQTLQIGDNLLAVITAISGTATSLEVGITLTKVR